MPKLVTVRDSDWKSRFNLEQKVTRTNEEVGDGGSSRVYKGYVEGEIVAVKQLKLYYPRHASLLIAAYDGIFDLAHCNVVKVLGICPNVGQIILEYCEKLIDGVVVHTLADLLLNFGNSLPEALRVSAILDVADGLQYLHGKGLVHGDIKPLNILVCGDTDEEYVFKITDYSCVGSKINTHAQVSSKSVSLKQLMTPAYMAPELLGDNGYQNQPTIASDIYSLGIFGYEVILCLDPWKHVTIDLIDRVKHGHRPALPDNIPVSIADILQKCWEHNHVLRPSAAEVSTALELYGEHMSLEPPMEVTQTCSLAMADTVSLATECDSTKCDDQYDYNTCDTLENSQHDCETVGSMDTENVSTLDSMQKDQTQSLSLAAAVSLSSIDKTESMSSTAISANNVESAMALLKIKELKQFQLDCFNALKNGKDAIIVQPTGSGKSVCFTLPALVSSNKVSLVIEPVVAIITNQVETLKSKGIDAVALGRAAGNEKSVNFRRVFQSTSNLPSLAYCTPEYLFGTPSSATYTGTSGQFLSLLDRKDFLSMVAIDEAHKIFDRMPDYRPAFDAMKQLKELGCPIVAMSATLTDRQIQSLKQHYLRCPENCIVLTTGVHRDNMEINLHRYKRRKCLKLAEDDDDDDDDIDNNEGDVSEQVRAVATSGSLWGDTISKIKPMIEKQSTVIYLDFVKDVVEVADTLTEDGIKVGRYTGQMNVNDRKLADKKFFQGDTSVLVATESFELGVDNPNVTQVIRIGCPRNLGVLLQELGRAGRNPGSIAKGSLFFNEVVDDKRLGLWLKSALASKESDEAVDRVRSEVIHTYIQAWKFIYSIYHGKCLSRALSVFYGGAGDTDPPTCFVSNSPLCAVCRHSEDICQWSVDVEPFLSVLLSAFKQIHEAGLKNVTKTLLISVILGTNEQYVRKFEMLTDLIEADDSCWGSGLYMNELRVSKQAWHKVIYVSVYMGLLDMMFDFRPYDNHHEVHRRYFLSLSGEEYVSNPYTVMSVDPQSNVVDVMLGAVETAPFRKCHQNRGKQLKPRVIDVLESPWTQGTIDKLKYIGFGNQSDTCMYFENCFAMPEATKNPHFLLDCIQFSRTQAGIKPITFNIDGVATSFMGNRSYCSGVKVCAGERCTYSVSTKQRVNRCTEHKSMALIPSGPCTCYITYVYPRNVQDDGRRWFVVLNAEKKDGVHNHPLPSEWKISPKVLEDITQMAQNNSRVTPKELQNGVGMSYRPMEISLAAANIDRVRTIVKKARQDVERVDNEKVNPFKIIASFPAIKERIDKNNTCDNSEEINKLVGTYQIDGDDAYCFGRDKRYALFQSPFQAYRWSQADVLFVDIDYTGCHHFPYLLNVVCLNTLTLKYIACGRGLLNRQDAASIGTVLSKLVNNVKIQCKDYNIKTAHKEILVDFDDAEANAFAESFGKDVTNILRGCSVHFLRSAMRVAKLVNSSAISPGYHIFMSIAKRIPDEPSKQIVDAAFSVLCGLESFETFKDQLPPDLRKFDTTQIDTIKWKDIETWVDWWKRPHVLKKLSKAYSLLPPEEWEDLPGTTNPVESINRQSIPQNVKSVSLKPLVEHMYLEDRRHAILEVATSRNITIEYQTKVRRRRHRPPKPPEKLNQLCTSIPSGKRAIGTRVSVEFYTDDQKSTTWYKGTVIGFNKKGYLITFDGCGPEENEVIKSLKKSIEKGELKII